MTIWKLTGKEPVRISGRNEHGEPAARAMEDSTEKVSKADALIADGNYIAAMGIYRSLFARDASNRHLRQRVEELRSLITLSGMQKDLIVARLERFLEMLVRRGNEAREALHENRYDLRK